MKWRPSHGWFPSLPCCKAAERAHASTASLSHMAAALHLATSAPPASARRRGSGTPARPPGPRRGCRHQQPPAHCSVDRSAPGVTAGSVISLPWGSTQTASGKLLIMPLPSSLSNSSVSGLLWRGSLPCTAMRTCQEGYQFHNLGVLLVAESPALIRGVHAGLL